MKSVQALKPGESEARETVPRLAVPEPHIQVVRAILCPLYRDILDLLLLTGARPGELLSLSEQMIDRSGTIWRSDLREHKNARRGKSRTLFFNSTAQEILKRYLVEKPDQKLFSVRRESYSKAVAKACDTADVPRFVPHQLRHCVATRLVDDLGTEAAQRLLGHSDRMMTEHYSKSADKQAQQAVQHLAETYRPQ